MHHRVASDRVMNFFKWLIGKSTRHSQPSFIKEKTVKILCMGRQGVGKTSVIHKLCDKDFTEDYSPTVYDDHLTDIIVDEYKVSFQFMDMGGSQYFPSMQDVFIRQADIYIIFYAVNDLPSFNEMLEYRDKIASVKGKHYTQLPILIVRNKLDMKEKRLKKEVQRRKTLNQSFAKIFDVSAKTGIKINAIMDSLIEESKFIGNEINPENLKISGRYLYQDHNGKRELSASEMYHKAPNLFGEKDNSEEKMEKRRRRSLQQPSRKMSRTLGKNGTISRRQSFGASFRRRKKEMPDGEKVDGEKPLWMSKAESEDNPSSAGADADSSSVKRESPPSFQKTSFDRVSMDKLGSKESVRTPSVQRKVLQDESRRISPVTVKTVGNDALVNQKHSLDQQLTKEKRRPMEHKYSLDEHTEHSPGSPFLSRPRLRKKSLSHTDINNLLVPENRLRSSSVNSPSFIQKVNAFKERTSSNISLALKINKPARPEIVHTTLKTGDEENVPILTYHKNSTRSRSYSTSSRDSHESVSPSKPPRYIDIGRRLSMSIDNLSDNEVAHSPPPTQRLTNRRRSLSQNDLLELTKGLNMSGDSMGKQANSSPKKLGKPPSPRTDSSSHLPRISGGSGHRPRTVSLYRRKPPAQSVIAEQDEQEADIPFRRKLSNSATDVLVTQDSDVKGKGKLMASKSFDENKNFVVWKKTKRPPLKKGASFDFHNHSPPK